jgi:hypothetical protein
MVNSGTPNDVPSSADCAIRTLAWEYGKELLPQRGEFKSLFDAMQLAACNLTAPSEHDQWHPPSELTARDLPAPTIYVDPSASLSLADPTGSLDAPFRTVEAAVERSRTLAKPLDILLRAGVHHLTKTIELGSSDSGLRIATYPGEAAELSGGVAIEPTWKPSSKCGAGCFESLLPTVDSIPGLRRNGIREIRARWPNFDEELDWVDEQGVYHVHNGQDGWASGNGGSRWTMKSSDMNGVGSWPPTTPPKTHIMGAADWPDVEWPMRQVVNATNGTSEYPLGKYPNWDGEGDWGNFWIGEGGTCVDRFPPVGYWCNTRAPRDIASANHPGGLQVEQVRGLTYKDPAGAIVHAWMPYHWCVRRDRIRRGRTSE